jgi:DNA invertase Pin-like site-specific DNA recombinase
MYAGYIRVSTSKQDSEMQRHSIDEHCRRNGITIYKIYKDEGISGKHASRPGLDEMLMDMRNGKFDGIVIYSLSRLGRSLINLLELLQEFNNKGIRLISTTDSVDTSIDSPTQRAFLRLLGVFAELQREIIVQNTNDGLAVAKKEGRIPGRRKGAKDKNKRRNNGYCERWRRYRREKERQEQGV